MQSKKHHLLFISLTVIGFIFLVILGFLLFKATRNGRGLKAQTNGQTAVITTVSGVATAVTFVELNADPYRYLNRRIRVSGAYQRPILPACVNPAGPQPRWSLINEELALEAINFTTLLQLAPKELQMTVEGIWRLYEGPVGCEKGRRGTVFYLDTLQIISPNPLSNAGGKAGSVQPLNEENATAVSPPSSETTPTAMPTLENGEEGSTPTTTPSPTATMIPDGSATATAVPSRTPAAPGTPVKETATPATSPTATPRASATPTVKSTAAATPTPTATSGAATPTAVGTSSATSTPSVGLPTPTPGGYPPAATAYP